MSREIITLKGKSREEQIALAQRVKAELERELPALAALREALVANGMMASGFSAIRAVKTEAIDYDVRRDDPRHDDKLYSKPPIITEEIIHGHHEFQARKIREARAAEQLSERRRSYRRRP